MSLKKLAGNQPGALDVVHFGGRRCGGERKPGCPWTLVCRTLVGTNRMQEKRGPPLEDKDKCMGPA